MSLDCHINNFAIRSFRNTADKDYIHARLAYSANLFPQFQWSALHCLEKYCKCIMLLNRIEAKKVGHEITPALKKISSHGKFQIELSDLTKAFIKHLEIGARFRYLEVSWASHSLELVKLDRAVWEIRRYCQPLDWEIEFKGKMVDMLALNLKKVSGIKDVTHGNTRLTGGLLEKIINNKNDPSRPGLIYKNLFYSSSKRKKVKMRSVTSSENSPLSLAPEILEEVIKYIYLPKNLIRKYRELIAGN
jgi:hypothetical protein